MATGVGPRIQARVLGPVEVWRGDVRLRLGGRRQRAVLARLLIGGGHVVPTETLADQLWPGTEPRVARNLLQVKVFELRRVLEPRRPVDVESMLVHRDPGYALPAATDADEFERLLAEARRLARETRDGQARPLLERALAGWSADRAYADFADEPWAAPTVARLGELRLEAEELRWNAALDAGSAPEAVAALRPLTEAHPLREGLSRLLALGLYRTDRQAEALETLRRAMNLVNDELGLDAAPALQELERAVLNHDPGLSLRTAPATVRAAPAAPAAPAAGLAPVPATARAGFVGRALELDDLLAAAGQAQAGALQVALVGGDPGIGKTRLAAVLAEALAGQGWAVRWGRSHEAAGAPPLWPWLQVFDEPDRDSGPRASAGKAGPRTRFDQHRELAARLAGCALDKPVLVVLDDLQWADAESVAVLEALPELVPGVTALVVATVRADALDRLAPTVARLARAGARTVVLTGLDEAAVEGWARAVGPEVRPDELLRRTGGNPFLLEETVRWARLRGARAALSELPAGAGALLRERVRRLGDDAGPVLQVTAVAGADVDAHLVEQVLADLSDGQSDGQSDGLSDDPGDDDGAPPGVRAPDVLDRAVRAGLLVASHDGLRFAHDLVRESIYDDVPPLRRQRLHGLVLTAMERSPARDVSAIARQALAAGPDRLDDAVRWSVAAAEHAARHLAHDDALRWWSAALDAHTRRRPPDPRGRTELLIRLVGARLDVADAIGAERTRAEALLEAEPVGDPLLLARVLVSLDRPGVWVLRSYGETDVDVVARLRDLLARPDLPGVLRSRLQATLANELSYGPTRPERLALTADAVEAARVLGDPQALAFALTSRYLALAPGTEWLTEVPAIGAELVGLAAEHGQAGPEFIGHLLLGMDDLGAGDFVGCERHLACADAVNRRLRLPLADLQVLCVRFNLACQQERWADAEVMVDAVRDAQIEWWSMGPIVATMRLFMLFRRGTLAADEALLAQVALVDPAIAHDARLLADPSAGEPAGWPDLAPSWLETAAWCLRGRAAAAVGDVDMCRRARAALLPWRGRVHVTGTVDGGRVDDVLARLDATLAGATSKAAPKAAPKANRKRI